MGQYPNLAGTTGNVQLVKGGDLGWYEKVNSNFKLFHTYRTHAYADDDPPTTENVDSNLPTGAELDRIIFLDTSAVNGGVRDTPNHDCTINLPDPADNLGREVIFIRKDNVQNINVTTSGSGSVLGDTILYAVVGTGLRAMYVSNGTNWYGKVTDN